MAETRLASVRSHQTVKAETFAGRDELAELAWQRDRLIEVCAVLRRLPSKETVADVGCLGGMAADLYKEAGVGTLHGYDISVESITRLRSRGHEGFVWNADGDPCPAADETYDVVVAGDIIEHLVETDSFVRELWRILKPGGCLILTTPNLASWYNRFRLLRGRPPRSYPGVSSTVRRDELVDLNHIRLHVVDEWRYLLEVHGFCVSEVRGVPHLGPLRGRLSVRLLGWIDRLASRWPTLASGVLFVGLKPVTRDVTASSEEFSRPSDLRC